MNESPDKIYIYGDIDEETAENFAQNVYLCEDQKIKTINLFICSDGGDVGSLIAILDLMIYFKAKRVKFRTVAEGKAYSCGAVILAYGTKGMRFARPNATIMLHPISYDSGHDYVNQQAAYSEFVKSQYENLVSDLAKTCGYKTKAEILDFQEKIEKTLWLDAKSAIEFGVIDEILC